MNNMKSPYISYEELRISKLLSSLSSNKMLTAVRYCANASVYDSTLAVLELTTAQSLILVLFYGLLNSDVKLCHFLQGLISKVDQLKSSYLSLWLRDDYKFNTSDVYKVLSNLARLIRGQHINLPDYVLRIFVGLNSKYGIIDICKANKDLEAFYFLMCVNVPCSRSQQTDEIPLPTDLSSSEMNTIFDSQLIRFTSLSSKEQQIDKGDRYGRVINQLMKEPSKKSDEEPRSYQRSHSSTISNQSAIANTFSNLTEQRKPEVKPRNPLLKEPSNESDRDRESKLFQRARSSSFSNRSRRFELSTYTDSSKPEVKPRSCLKKRSRTPQPIENKSLAHAISTPNIAELSIKNDEMSPEAELVQSYLSKIETTPVPFSQISRLVCKRDRKGGKSPLHLASKDGLLAVVKGLIKYGAPVNCRDDIGLTPAHYAAREGNIEILEVLKNHKADLTAVGDSGDSLLHHAAKHNHAGTCGWLLENHVPIDAQGYKGRTALHCAAMWGYLDTVRLLLMHKASVQIKDYYHNTACDLASSQGHTKVAIMLRNVI